jgi:exopolyphosphatase/guanosine-5'-triphosphate,3'-diphosphate pyrophosphatase
MPNRFVFNPLRDQAVIDIGSNSVRLVIYRVEGRANAPILNEKVLAGLGRGVPETGRLNPVGVRRALEALRRFRLLVDAIGVQTIRQALTSRLFQARRRGVCRPWACLLGHQGQGALRVI